MKLTATQQGVVDRYMKATEDCPEDRMSVAALLTLYQEYLDFLKEDIDVLARCEEHFLIDERVEEY